MQNWRRARCIRPMDSTATIEPGARAQLDRLWARGRDFLGCEAAIMGGAMTWVSERNLVSAISEAGAFGVIACGAMEPDRLALEIAGTRALTDKPFGVNLITMHPKLDALIDVCGEAGISHIVLAGGLPGRAAMRRVKGWGARLICLCLLFTSDAADDLTRVG
ncbi:MAG: nitronate monooxygenase, partial [Chloroflexi bacterium]|nr:nitronate monooxygenase [Chloroflexota bacterium]